MAGYDKPIQIEDFNERSKGESNYNHMPDDDEEMLEIPEAMEENKKKLNELCGIKEPLNQH